MLLVCTRACTSTSSVLIIGFYFPDPTLTVGNVLGVIENVVVDRRENVFASYPRLRMKFLECLPEEQRLHAFADSYVNCYPEASWIELCQRLYEDNEMIAARKAKVFIPQAGE